MEHLKLFSSVKNWLLDLEFNIQLENEEHQSFIIEKESEGIKNMMIVIAPQILII